MKSSKKHSTKKYNHKHRLVFAILIGISVVSFWRGTWGLMDLYLFPHNQTISFIMSFAIGLCILFFSHYVVKELIGE